VPLIHGPDGAKLSKRHGALGVEAYRAMGYLPDAMRNYLIRLGWSHGDDEIFSTEQAVEWFNLESLGRSPSRFDFTKLENLNGHYIRAANDDDLISAMQNLLPHKVNAAMPGLKERAKTVNELFEGAHFLFSKRPIPLDEKSVKALTPEAREILAKVIKTLEKLPDWTTEALDSSIRTLAEDLGLKFGAIAQPLRAALTGRKVSPGIFDVLYVLGCEESLARLKDQAKG
jgi:glutamyl-tRNA synthetase